MEKTFTQHILETLRTPEFTKTPTSNITIFDLSGDQLTGDSIRQSISNNLYGNVKVCAELFLLHKSIYKDVIADPNPFAELLTLISAGDKSDWTEKVKSAQIEKIVMNWTTLLRNVIADPELKVKLGNLIPVAALDLYWE